jgi:hypothetical protein
MKPPSCATSPPLGDGAHKEKTGRVIWKCMIFLIGNTSLSPFGDAKAAGACLHAPMSVRIF